MKVLCVSVCVYALIWRSSYFHFRTSFGCNNVSGKVGCCTCITASSSSAIYDRNFGFLEQEQISYACVCFAFAKGQKWKSIKSNLGRRWCALDGLDVTFSNYGIFSSSVKSLNKCVWICWGVLSPFLSSVLVGEHFAFLVGFLLSQKVFLARMVEMPNYKLSCYAGNAFVFLLFH